MRPHRWQPTRLPRPWDSPGKNTGVGCHFLLQCMKVKSESEVAQSCLTPSDPMDCSPPGLSVHGIFQTRILDGLPLPSPDRNLIELYSERMSHEEAPTQGSNYLTFLLPPVIFLCLSYHPVLFTHKYPKHLIFKINRSVFWFPFLAAL